MSSIPASQIVSVIPNVLSAGGQALELNGLVLSQNTRFPIGQIVQFPTADAVEAYCGAASLEAIGANVYFNGFDNSSVKPGRILFYQYPTSAVAAYLRGGSLAGLTLTQLKALTGVLTLTVNGIATTSATINLSSATSFSNAATIIQAAFASPAFTVSFDSISSAFIFLVNTTGVGSTITYATGTLSTSLALTLATAATLSQGAAATDPVTAMNAITALTQNWASFLTAFNPDVSGNANKLLFAQWTAQQNRRYAYVCFDTDVTPGQVYPATSSVGYILQQSNSDGTIPIFEPTNQYMAWFVSGSIASVNFNETNGNTDFAFKSQSGISATVTDATIASNLLLNGYNFYGAYATANDQFIWLYNGQISGSYKSIRAYINQIWLTNQLQLAEMVYLAAAKATPYNIDGYSAIEAAALDPINQALNFGAIQPGVTLSENQKSQINNAAGIQIADVIEDTGWYLQILDASPQVRQAGGSPPIKFWYTDGGSVRKLDINSIDVQ